MSEYPTKSKRSRFNLIVDVINTALILIVASPIVLPIVITVVLYIIWG